MEAFSRCRSGRFRYLFEPHPGKSYALNAGIAAAKGDALAFMDDDVTIVPEWLWNLVAPLRDGGFAGTGGRVVPRWATEPPNWLPNEGWASTGPLVSFDRGSEGHTLEDSPFGTNMAYLRRVFEHMADFESIWGLARTARSGMKTANLRDASCGRENDCIMCLQLWCTTP